MRKTTIAVLTALMMVMATAAVGKMSIDDFDKDGWACGPDFVANHCLNTNSKGRTLNIKVFDPRGPQESASADPKADSRPCPHDAGGSGPFGADPTAGDGTWWDYLYGSDMGPLYVCHHSGQQQFLP
jgi:hypothetical protein